jgi:hypothetical protein
MRSLLLVTLVLPLATAGHHSPAVPRSSKPIFSQSTVAHPRYSTERLHQIRAALAAQIAVRDDAEQAMRAPTPDEAAALALPVASAEPQAIAVSGGGIAIRTDGSHMSFVHAYRGKDGKVEVSHAR